MARILIVEDDSRLALSLRVRLEALGHQVSWARDGIEALAAAGREELDLMLLDLSLPRLDGIQVARHLLAQDARERVPIVLVTGSRAEDYPGQQDLFAELEVLRKPYTCDELCACLERALRRHSDAVQHG